MVPAGRVRGNPPNPLYERGRNKFLPLVEGEWQSTKEVKVGRAVGPPGRDSLGGWVDVI